MKSLILTGLLTGLLTLAACGGATDTAAEGCGPDALSTCSAPAQPADHYADQGMKYFDSLDESADPESKPDYAEGVARWEWPPWLLLTGYGADLIAAIDVAVLAAQPGTTVPIRDCRGFDVQPFGRCKVVFDFEGKPCPIFEEFTFNDEGQVTFVEAWSDLPGLGPTADTDADTGDTWAEGEGVHRLSTRIPGLGSPTGAIDPTGEAMTAAGASDPEVADFAARTQDFWGYWSETYAAAGDDLYTRGCGW